MNERERADSLARAIDELIRGAHKKTNVEDDELRSLLRVAEARRQAGIETGQRSADHESAVWQRLTARLDNQDEHSDEPPDEHRDDDMRDVIAARRRVSEDIHELAERHREEVWQRIQEKVTNPRPRKRRIFSFLQSRTDGDLPLRRTGWGHTGLVLTGDADTDSLLRVALANPSMRHTTRATTEAQHQLRVRMRSDPARQRSVQPEPAPERPRTGFMLRAGAVAAIAVVAAVLGPVPLTGLAGSPAAAAARYALDHLAVTETDDTPPAPGDSATVEGVDMTAGDAFNALGLPVVSPADVIGFPLTTQRFYPQGMAGGGAGLFVASYAGDGASVALYEEAAGGSDLAVPAGIAVDTTVDGISATYYEGSWSQAADGSLAWLPTGTQTIVFERDGVRFTIVYTGPHLDPAVFATAAGTVR